MAYSRIVRYGTGSTNTFNVQFTLGYIEEADVKCRVGNEVDGTGNPVYRTCSFNTPGFITISGAAPGNGVQVVFERTVDKEHIPVDFSDGSEMDETNLDTLQTVLMMQIHEVLDGRFSTLANDLDMGTFRVVNVGEPVNAQDAATKNYTDTKIATGAANAAAAAASATTANTAAANAGTQAGAAAVSATLSEKWASWPVDTEVVTGKYSAYHWAYKAALSAAAAATFNPSSYYTKAQIDAAYYVKTDFKNDGTGSAPIVYNADGSITTNASLNITGVAGATKALWFYTGNSQRWEFFSNAGAEAGSNVGSDLELKAFSDAGASLGNVFSVARASRILNFNVSPTAPTPTVGDNSTKLATTAYVMSASSPWPSGYISGYPLTYVTTTTFSVGAGDCRNEDGGSPFNMALASAITKSLSSWAVGSGNGSLDTGTITTNTWYHVHAIRKTSDGSIDILLSLSATAPTMPSGYVARRRLGSVKTNGSSQLTQWTQSGDEFLWYSPVIDVDAVNPGGTAVTRTLSVPTGVVVAANINVGFCLGTGPCSVLVTALASVDVAPQAPNPGALTGFADVSNSSSTAGWSLSPKRVLTNTLAQVRSRMSVSGSGQERLGITTFGWLDTRGKN